MKELRVAYEGGSGWSIEKSEGCGVRSGDRVGKSFHGDMKTGLGSSHFAFSWILA